MNSSRRDLPYEELATLREAWLAVSDASELIDQAVGLKWHEDAEKCRERIRDAISIGFGCSAVSHLPDDPSHWRLTQRSTAAA